MQLVNLTTGDVLADKVETADTFFKRFKGLMLKKYMPESYAMHLKPCRSIHTFFMKFPIDVLYLDGENNIVGIEENLAPGKIGKKVKKARTVVELPKGQISKTETEVGHSIGYKTSDTLKQSQSV